MLTRLNLETRSLHPDADALWVALLSPHPSTEDYSSALVAAYGFEAPVEAALALTPGVNAALSLRPRARTGLLVQDLLMLGFSPSAIARLPQCCRIVPYRDVAEALGWLYVIERATLIHDSVRRHLELALPRAAHAFCFLSAYEGHTGMRWQELGGALDRAASTEDLEDQIIAAARDAFATQRHWLVTEAKQLARN
jgi:heme oxygenase (biliverdin-IX-beta and delta-forming)